MRKSKPPEVYDDEIKRIKKMLKRPDDMMEISVLGTPGYETFSKDDDPNIYVRPVWNTIATPPTIQNKVLAVIKGEKGMRYNCNAYGWFHDTVYSCWMQNGKFIMEGYGIEIPATHWMPAPLLPEG